MPSSETPVHPVKAARQSRGERLVDVAGNARISVSYLSMIEHGLVPPPHRQAALAKALEQPEAELWP
ncbi:MAG TPA: helix-turn-helix transcriptional regulator [Solirubrobacterales bacterium]|jgi:transcriptional regulator with XRE-family HTH domain